MIIFKHIKIQNFLSIGNKPVELNLDSHNITLISGENGASKSAICIDSIFYALYGKSFRKVTLSKLINSYNKKGMLIELEFSINEITYRIVRGQKPNVFEIYVNNQIKPQMANVKDYQAYLSNHILRMDEKTFRQLVVIGSSSYTPFMLLSAPERRVVIEQLLRIDIFSTMQTLTKQYISNSNTNLSELVHRADTLSLKIEMHKRNNENIHNQLLASISEYNDEISSLEEKKQNEQNHYQSLLDSVDKNRMTELKSVAEKISATVQQLKQLRTKKVTQGEQTEKFINFFKKNNVCPTCTQELPEEFAHEKLSELNTKLTKNENDLKEFDNKISSMESSYKETVNKFNSIIDELNKAENIKREIETINSNINLCKKKIESLEERIQKETHTENIDLISYNKELDEVNLTINQIKKKLEALNIISSMLKDDGVKSIIIKSYLKIINALIQKYLNIIGYNVVFELDESFSETIHTKHMEDFEYNNFSEGERLRLDSAIMFAFRDLARIQSSTSTNILILDEFDHGTLDSQGFDSIVEILKSLKNQNIFIISHSTDYFQTIADRHLLAIKKNHFSELRSL